MEYLRCDLTKYNLYNYWTLLVLHPIFLITQRYVDLYNMTAFTIKDSKWNFVGVLRINIRTERENGKNHGTLIRFFSENALTISNCWRFEKYDRLDMSVVDVEKAKRNAFIWLKIILEKQQVFLTALLILCHKQQLFPSMLIVCFSPIIWLKELNAFRMNPNCR